MPIETRFQTGKDRFGISGLQLCRGFRTTKNTKNTKDTKVRKRIVVRVFRTFRGSLSSVPDALLPIRPWVGGTPISEPRLRNCCDDPAYQLGLDDST